MKRKIATLLMLSCIAMSITACGNSKQSWASQYDDYRKNKVVASQMAELPAVEAPTVESTPVDEIGYQTEVTPASTQEQISEENTLYEYEVQSYTEVPVQAEQDGVTAVIIEENPVHTVSAENQAAKEAEERQLAEEKAAQEEAQRLTAEQAAQSSNANSTGTSTAQNTTTNPVQNNTVVAPTQSGTMVWILDHTDKYHNDPNAHDMVNPRQVTLDEAKRLGKDACGWCYR